MLEAVIFDMDGLMVDTEPLHSEAFSAVIRQYGHEPILNENGLVQLIAVGPEKNWTHIKQKHGFEADTEILIAKKIEFSVPLFQDRKRVKAMPGLFKFIKLLDKHNIKRGLASTARRENIEGVLAVLELEFEIVISGYEVKRHKPAPDIFLEAAKLLGVEPAKCLVLEDSENGVVAGHTAGMKVIAVPNIYTHKHDFDKANLVVPSLDKLDWRAISGLFGS